MMKRCVLIVTVVLTFMAHCGMPQDSEAQDIRTCVVRGLWQRTSFPAFVRARCTVPLTPFWHLDFSPTVLKVE